MSDKTEWLEARDAWRRTRERSNEAGVNFREAVANAEKLQVEFAEALVELQKDYQGRVQAANDHLVNARLIARAADEQRWAAVDRMVEIEHRLFERLLDAEEGTGS